MIYSRTNVCIRQKILISILIPALNEEAGIERTISSIPKDEIHELGYSLEIIVIDGNSADLTREIALQKGSQVIVRKKKRIW